MYFPPERIVAKIKMKYPEGTRVKLVSMDDIQAPPVGTKGTVKCVDDSGTVHVSWDGYGNLGVIYGVDEIKKVR